MHSLHILVLAISYKIASQNRLRQRTPCGRYAFIACSRRRETIETYSLFTVTPTFNPVNAFMDTKTRNNIELKINRILPCIHSYRHNNNTHLEQYSSIIFIQLNFTYIHTLFLYISQFLTTTEIFTLDSTASSQQQCETLYKGNLRALPSNYSTLSYRNKIFQLLNIYYNKYPFRQIRVKAPDLYCNPSN
jgi:hypothetical protein